MALEIPNPRVPHLTLHSQRLLPPESELLIANSKSLEEIGYPSLTLSPQGKQDQPEIPFLSRQDLDRLTRFKWRYSLEAHGFSETQGVRLLFARWMYGQGIIGG